MRLPFYEQHGCIGLGSEEGFEAAHNRLRSIKTMLQAMPFARDRGTKMGQRYQISLLPEFERTWQELNPGVKRRHAYKKKTPEEKESKAIECIGEELVDNAPIGCKKLESSSLIFDSWFELYQFVLFGMVTKTMRGYLEANVVLSGPGRQKARNLIDYAS